MTFDTMFYKKKTSDKTSLTIKIGKSVLGG